MREQDVALSLRRCFEDKKCSRCWFACSPHCMYDMGIAAAEAIEGLLKEVVAHTWKNGLKEKPEKGGYYFVWQKGASPEICVCYYNKDTFAFERDGQKIFADFWMEAPQRGLGV